MPWPPFIRFTASSLNSAVNSRFGIFNHIPPASQSVRYAPALDRRNFGGSSYLWTDDGWLYLAIVMDLFNREIVGRSLKPRMTADIVTDALTMGGFRKRPAPGLLHHSDRGSQYASQAFQDKLREYGMAGSMSRKGNCWDNAPTEIWFNSFKNERVHGVSYASHADMKDASFEYIEVFYNRKRLHSTLGYRSPVQFLEHWISQKTQENLVA